MTVFLRVTVISGIPVFPSLKFLRVILCLSWKPVRFASQGSLMCQVMTVLVCLSSIKLTDTQPDCKVLITTSSGNSKDPPVATMVKVAKEAYSHEQPTSKTKFSFPEITSPKTASSNLESLRTADFLRPTS